MQRGKNDFSSRVNNGGSWLFGPCVDVDGDGDVDAFLLHMHPVRLSVHCCGIRLKTQLTANLWLTSWLFQTDFYRNVVSGGGAAVGGEMQMVAGHMAD